MSSSPTSDPESTPVHVVIPVLDQLRLTRALVDELVCQGRHEAIWVFDNGCGSTARAWLEASDRGGRIRLVDAVGWNLHRMWNHGVDLALAADPGANVAVLNNDLEIGPCFLDRLSRGLGRSEDLWVVSPNYDGRDIVGVQLVTSTFKNDGLAGFAFMASATALRTVRFDEGLRWWYGDDDLVWQVEQAGHRVGIVADVTVNHVCGGSRTVRYTPEVIATIEHDMGYALGKWFGGITRTVPRDHRGPQQRRPRTFDDSPGQQSTLPSR